MECEQVHSNSLSNAAGYHGWLWALLEAFRRNGLEAQCVSRHFVFSGADGVNHQYAMTAFIIDDLPVGLYGQVGWQDIGIALAIMNDLDPANITGGLEPTVIPLDEYARHKPYKQQIRQGQAHEYAQMLRAFHEQVSMEANTTVPPSPLARPPRM